ncbi:MFS transporter [Helcobacillus sp. ACRRO]|uniref:MFS transporter n=1 Tax=Helcobacillus sp. ACRRO TaxID=2918202 RepID=UPI001EF66A61|nr:MFS transporter [Helcobacillus sp. ACRRO]MCG7427686.1 MFS transporter [Helcobacillus sp. ACRRO]
MSSTPSHRRASAASRGPGADHADGSAPSGTARADGPRRARRAAEASATEGIPWADGFRATDSWLFGAVLAVLTFWLFAQTLVNVKPDIEAELGTATTITNLAVSITALFSGIFVVLAGSLADRLGRATILKFGLLLSIIGSGLIAGTPVNAGGLTTSMLLGGRIIQGLSIAAIMPAVLALISTFYEGAARQRAVSFFSIGTFGGSALTSIVGGVVASAIGWRFIFIASILAAALSLYLVRKTPNVKAEFDEAKGYPAFDWGGFLTFMIALVAINVYISQGKLIGWTSWIGILLLVVFAVFAVAFILWENKRRGLAPFIDLGLFSNKRFFGPTLANFLVNMGVAVLLVTQTLAQKGAGMSALQASLLTLGYMIAIFLVIRVGEKLLRRFGPKKPMLWGLGIVAIGTALNTLTFVPQTPYLVFAFIGFTCFGMGLGFFATPATDAAISSVPKSQTGAASGIFKMGSSLGGAIGIAIAAALMVAGSGVAIQTVQDWGFFTGWTAEAGPLRFGAFLGNLFVVIMMVVALVATVITVPAGQETKE